MSARKITSLFLSLLVTLALGACAAELGEPCDYDSQCPDGAICRNNLYIDALCEEGVVPIESEGPEGYCTVVCESDDDCSKVPNSDGCLDDPRSGRNLCMPDCP